jgi:hypothetical protein
MPALTTAVQNAESNGKSKDIKSIHHIKKKNCFQMTWSYIDNLKNSPKKATRANKESQQTCRVQKSVMLPFNSNERSERECKKTASFTIA